MKITAKTAAKADAYRLQRVTTTENLEMKMMHNGGVVITFGDRILIAGYYYQPNGDGNEVVAEPGKTNGNRVLKVQSTESLSAITLDANKDNAYTD